MEIDIEEIINDTNDNDNDNLEDIYSLYKRLCMWNEKCSDLFVDLRTINYEANPDDTYITFKDPSYHLGQLYFKVDPDKPKDPKIIHATKQLCKVIGIPYNFFVTCRPSLKMNIIRTWQAGLAESDKKSQNIFKIRESPGCTIIRGIIPISKTMIPLNELVRVIMESTEEPIKIEGVYGDEKDDLILNARFLFKKQYDFKTPIKLGFILTASELDACPLTIDVMLYNNVSKTCCIPLYGGDPFFKSDYKNLQASNITDLIPVMINRLNEEIPEILKRLNEKEENVSSTFNPDLEALDICQTKGLTAKIKTAIYHQIAECCDDIKSPWDVARHVGLVAKDFDALKRLKIERAIGKYLNLYFGKDS
jgi:hypothetical protein